MFDELQNLPVDRSSNILEHGGGNAFLTLQPHFMDDMAGILSLSVAVRATEVKVAMG